MTYVCYYVDIYFESNGFKKKYRGNARPLRQICFTIGFMRCCPSQVFKSILHKLGIYYRYGQESISISDIVPLVVLDLNSSERL